MSRTPPVWPVALLALLAFSTAFACSSRPLASTESGNTSGEAGASAGPAPAMPQHLDVLTGVHISSNPEAEHHQSASAEVDFGSQPVELGVVRVELESPCFPFEKWSELEIPNGHRWPLLCDAFDRGLSLTLHPLDEADDSPPLELLRAVTPFGGPIELEQDITDVVNGLPGRHRLELQIDTWGDPDGQVSGAEGEWLASVTFDLTPGTAPRSVLAVVPLVYENQVEPDAGALTFEVPSGSSSGRLEYRATGHGGVQDIGCLGPAEEFCRRTHELRIDGELSEVVPWRSDCADLCTLAENEAELGPQQYCAENPCGALQSVRASRANWCPGSQTPPFTIETDALTAPGEHVLSRHVPELREGGSWHVSLTYFAFE